MDCKTSYGMEMDSRLLWVIMVLCFQIRVFINKRYAIKLVRVMWMFQQCKIISGICVIGTKTIKEILQGEVNV